jgi:hypothetical protein
MTEFDRSPPSVPANIDAVTRFTRLVQTAWQEGQLESLLLTRYTGDDVGLQRLTVREVLLRGERQWSMVWRYATRDITKNMAPEAGLAVVTGLLGRAFQNAHLHTPTQATQLAFSRKGRASLRVGAVAGASVVMPALAHNQEKQRHLSLAAPFWIDLGLTHEVKGKPALVPAMSRKWKQINKFIEVMDAAFDKSPLAEQRIVHAADFGSGKGYLTFALHDWLQQQGKQACVTGIELRADMVNVCNAAATRHGREGLRFEQGDVRSRPPPSALDVMIALHACDTATDHALHLGLRAGASIIMASPCCHKELRPHMHMPPLLRPMLQHGIHLGQQAEMVTDSLRALLLEAEGYDTQVFEFVALEHTSKNKMILAVKRRGSSLAAATQRRDERLAQIAEIKRFYGLQAQCLERLLHDPVKNTC